MEQELSLAYRYPVVTLVRVSVRPSACCTTSCCQTRELVYSRTAVSNAEQLQQLPLVSSWGAAAAADAPQQPEGFTLLPPGITGEARVSLQQGAAWGLPVVSPFDWQQLVLRPTAASDEAGQQEQQQQGEQLGGNSLIEARVSSSRGWLSSFGVRVLHAGGGAAYWPVQCCLAVPNSITTDSSGSVCS